MSSRDGTAQASQSAGSNEENTEVQWVGLEDMAPVCSCGLSTGIVAGAVLMALFLYLLPPLPVRAAALVGNITNNNITSSSAATTHAFTYLPQKNVCFSKDCSFMARVLRKFINEHEDPCNDFYEYVCGRYEVHYGDLRTVLERQSVGDITAMVNSPYSVPPQGQSPVQKAMALRHACYTVRARNLEDTTDLTDFMKSQEIDLVEDNTRDPTPNVFMLSLYYDVHIIFSAQVSPTALNSKKQRLLSLAYNERYFTWLNTKAQKSQNFRDRYYKEHLTAVGVKDYDYFRTKIWDIESKMYSALNKVHRRTDAMKEMIITDLGHPAFLADRWLLLMRTYVHQNYTSEDTVTVSNRAVYYFHSVQERTLSFSELNLLTAWETVRQLGSFVHHQLSMKLGSRFYAQCESMTLTRLEFSNAYFLYSVAPRVVEAARNLTSKVRNELLTRATAATLLPNKDEVLMNIASMDVIVGFPQALDTAAKLDAFWEEFPDVRYNKFLHVWLQVHRKRVRWLLNHPKYYIFPSIPVRTYYDSTRHLFLVPPSMLTTYFFGVESLASLNFAGLGHFVGTGMAETIATPAGNNCSSDSVATLLGLEAAYGAYVHTTLRDSSRLPLMNVASRRLFFLAACLKTCAMRSPGGNQKSEPCNAVVRNMDAFAKAYNCSPGANMNPKDKCKPW